MDEQITRLVDKVWEKFKETPPDRRLIIAIAGIPGSGKTTLTQLVTSAINARHATLDPSNLSHTRTPIAAFVPMDGYHLTRAQLSAMPDPITAHARRGAEFTFDGPAFLRLVQALREPINSHSAVIRAPSFDHAVKDPVPDAITILPSHRVILLEGNYTLLDREPWKSAASLADERWFVEVDFSIARRRLIRRHLVAGIVATEEEADRRAVENDLPNGEEIVRLRLPVDEVIVSREDSKWV
ncbi:hypothetical protein VTK73DRAFT_9710 [Phialemonium thermophilum]|uniref:Phosphoribulokinase/uridine kinase domain-containing protein n=1 Tax=Phialemonium thermophilum TaxID=223376 RepID=A0ABR3XJ00_9PEZI